MTGLPDKKSRRALLSLVLLCASLCFTQDIGRLRLTDRLWEAVVTRVADGDTFTVSFISGVPPGCKTSEKVRFIGVDTPEYYKTPRQYYADEAKQYVEHIKGKRVWIEFDSSTSFRDKYGRLLGYVWLDPYRGIMLNESLIALGYGRYYDKFKFSSEWMKRFEKDQEKAAAAGRGLWKPGGAQ